MFYLYAIIAGSGLDAELPEEGIQPDVAVHAVACDGLACIVSEVPAEIFGEATLRHLLEHQPAWTEERVVAHERVVGKLAASQTLLPLKFCTLFSDRDSMIRMMERNRDALTGALAQIRGTREWGVKLFYDPTRLRSWLDAEPGAEPAPMAKTAGAAFFARKQNEMRRRLEVEAAARRCGEESHRRLAELAREAVATAPQPPELHGRGDEMILNGAYLVAEGDEAALRDCVHALSQAHTPSGFDFVLTGPWAPYNFTRLYLGELT
jgi:hypothetical protein